LKNRNVVELSYSGSGNPTILAYGKTVYIILLWGVRVASLWAFVVHSGRGLGVLCGMW